MRTLILGLAAAAAAAVEVGASSSLPSISQLLEADARYSTFVEALYATDLYDALDAYGPYTVFAPTNRAFAALDAYVRTALLKNKRQLKNLVLNHVVGAATLTTELVDGDELESLARHALLVRVGSSMRVDDAEVVERDELASNGVLDGLGDVLVPCPDDPAWAKKNQPEMKCEWVLEHGPRCDAKGENNIPAWSFSPRGRVVGDGSRRTPAAATRRVRGDGGGRDADRPWRRGRGGAAAADADVRSRDRRARAPLRYKDERGTFKSVGVFETQEEAAHAYNAALKKVGLDTQRKVNQIDAEGKLVPKPEKGTALPLPADLPAGERKPKYHGVYYKGSKRKFEARFRDGEGNNKTIAYFTNQEEAAHAYNATIKKHGLEASRHTNEVDAAGQLVPKRKNNQRYPVPKSKYYGVHHDGRKFQARFTDAYGKQKTIGRFFIEDDAAHAYNAAIKKHGLCSKRKTNPVDAAGRLIAKPGRGA